MRKSLPSEITTCISVDIPRPCSFQNKRSLWNASALVLALPFPATLNSFEFPRRSHAWSWRLASVPQAPGLGPAPLPSVRRGARGPVTIRFTVGNVCPACGLCPFAQVREQHPWAGVAGGGCVGAVLYYVSLCSQFC